jgi:hypothetical protein
MLLGFVILYLVISIGIGMYAATRVHTARDYISAGRALPIYIVMAMVFATWFGAETVLGIPATFMEEDLAGLISDPFGASLCLILFGLFFARKLYRMNLLTIADYYRERYDNRVELITGIAIVLSYLGWVSAQITALGLVFNVLSDGQITQAQGIMIGAAVVLMYTLYGGMWSVALTTFFQMIVIVLGLLYIAWLVSDMTGGVMPVIEHAAANEKFNFWPELNTVAMIAFISGLITMGFGSIPQQDVFQRANASKNENVAVWGTVLGGVAYFMFAAVPLFLAYSANLIDPALVTRWLAEDSQKLLPELVRGHLPLVRAGDFLRRVAVGDHVHRLRHSAGAVGDAVGKRAEALLYPPQTPVRQKAIANHALDRCHFRGVRDALRAVGAGRGNRHPPDGGERLQGDAGGRFRAAGRRPVLAARQYAGRLSGDRPGLADLDSDGTLAAGRRSLDAAAVRRISDGRRRHDRRFLDSRPTTDLNVKIGPRSHHTIMQPRFPP